MPRFIAPSQIRGELRKLAAEDVPAKINKGLLRAARRGQKLLRKRSPIGASGAYAAAWTDPIPLADGNGYEVINTAPHAVFVELGTRPHMPPVEPIIRWAQLVLGLDEKAATKVGWAIALKIKAEGTKAQHIALGAEPELRKFVLEEVRRALEED